MQQDPSRRILVSVLLGLLSGLCATAGASNPETVRFDAEDGYTLVGSRWEPEQAFAGVLLVHACDSDRSSVAGFGRELSERGIAAVSFDFRGLGDSRTEEFDLLASSTSGNWSRAEQGFGLDVRAAVRVLRSLLPENAPIGLVGMSCGGREALLFAMEDPGVAAVSLVSSRLGSGNVERLQSLAKTRSVYVAAALGDRRAAAAARAVESMGPPNDLAQSQPSAKAQLFPGSAHATALMAVQPSLLMDISAWLSEQLTAASSPRQP